MVDFEHYRTVSLRETLKTGGSAHGGLTVRDYFAAKAMATILKIEYKQFFNYALEMDEEDIAECDFNEIAAASYDIADVMMREREKPVQKATPSVEEAFGLDK